MSEFIISDIDPSLGDTELLKEVKSPLQNLVEERFRDLNTESKHLIESTIHNLKQRNATFKKSYIADINKTYSDLIAVISQAKSEKKNLNHKISGIYANHHAIPCLDYWIKCNPGKIAAINMIMKQLRDEGWNPRIMGVSEYKSEYNGVYSGGRELTIICDFNQ